MILSPWIINCKDEVILRDWNRLQTSDHFYYMSTKWFSEGLIKTRINPFHSPYDAFINFMNVLADFEIRVKKSCEKYEESVDADAEMASKPKKGAKKAVAKEKKTLAKATKTKTKEKEKEKEKEIVDAGSGKKKSAAKSK
jgi:alpha-amylase